jgi:hypothetical protein
MLNVSAFSRVFASWRLCVKFLLPPPDIAPPLMRQIARDTGLSVEEFIAHRQTRQTSGLYPVFLTFHALRVGTTRFPAFRLPSSILVEFSVPLA